MQQRLQSVTHRYAPQDGHEQLIVIDRDVGVLEAGRHFELTWRDLVVPRDDRNAELVRFALDLGETRHDAFRDADEIVVLELLSARRWRAEERTAPHHEVGSL